MKASFLGANGSGVIEAFIGQCLFISISISKRIQTWTHYSEIHVLLHQFQHVSWVRWASLIKCDLEVSSPIERCCFPLVGYSQKVPYSRQPQEKKLEYCKHMCVV
ncbi:unnamed protein product [Linum trigynum]|uniref:Uncharacterized protein n=1 Tax=Linum trigynum TaxID=586398 RepID=A0AAV2DSM4_9ROSI